MADAGQSNQPEDREASGEESVALPIDGCLDLHTFRPQDVKVVVPEYIEACLGKGILKIRIVHGKGTGQLRRTVHALLARHPAVASYALAGEFSGGWGATIVALRGGQRPADGIRPAPGNG